MALKETTPSQTGLKKLPKSVRNTMGYMNSGGVSTKKKAKKKKDKVITVVSISIGKIKKKKKPKVTKKGKA
jgi:hypothetical protein|tara:strand:+ start:1058 stop:1270 length:213 start_codon:yes stop_codon:yes gene_type:complete